MSGLKSVFVIIATVFISNAAVSTACALTPVMEHLTRTYHKNKIDTKNVLESECAMAARQCARGAALAIGQPEVWLGQYMGTLSLEISLISLVDQVSGRDPGISSYLAVSSTSSGQLAGRLEQSAQMQ